MKKPQKYVTGGCGGGRGQETFSVLSATSCKNKPAVAAFLGFNFQQLVFTTDNTDTADEETAKIRDRRSRRKQRTRKILRALCYLL